MFDEMFISIYTTGGSIDKTYSTQASDFVVGQPQVAAILREANVNLTVKVTELVCKDSLNITDDDRTRLVAAVTEDTCRHILVTHGTDTMVRTAMALRGVRDKVIVVTGAMRPAAFKDGDASFNVGGAVVALQTLPVGIYIVMSGRVFRPDATRKNPDTDQFDPI